MRATRSGGARGANAGGVGSLPAMMGPGGINPLALASPLDQLPQEDGMSLWELLQLLLIQQQGASISGNPDRDITINGVPPGFHGSRSQRAPGGGGIGGGGDPFPGMPPPVRQPGTGVTPEPDPETLAALAAALGAEDNPLLIGSGAARKRSLLRHVPGRLTQALPGANRGVKAEGTSTSSGYIRRSFAG